LTRRDARRAIERLLDVVRSDPNDMRSRLELGDLYARAGDAPHALQMYEEVALYYAHQGLPLKAIAVYKQICAIVVRDAPYLRPRYAHVPPILAELLQQLGLLKDAVAALDALGQDVAGGSGGLS
jgi:tetratricopeptide (TPR) repeat protein